MSVQIGGVVEVSAASQEPVDCGQDGCCKAAIKNVQACEPEESDAVIMEFLKSLVGDDCEVSVADLGDGIKCGTITKRVERSEKQLPFKSGDTVVRRSDRAVFQVSTCGWIPGDAEERVFLCGEKSPVPASDLQLLAETKHKHHAVIRAKQLVKVDTQPAISMLEFQRCWAEASEVHVREVNELHEQIENLTAKLERTRQKSARRHRQLRLMNKPMQQLTSRRKALAESSRAAVELADIQLSKLDKKGVVENV